jgi:hypothetical protein
MRGSHLHVRDQAVPSATKLVQIFPYSEGEWVTVWMCDEHYDGYGRMADRIPGVAGEVLTSGHSTA